MSPRPDATALRRPQIIEAAITVYRKRGFAKARMDDIAEEAGVSKGLLYRYFKSKDDLTLAILTEMLRGEAAGMQALLDEDAPVPDKLLRLNDLIVGDMRQFLELAPITFEFYASAERDFAVNEALQQSYGEMRAQLRRLIEQGTTRGELRAVDADKAAITLMALYEGLLVLYVVAPDTFDWTEQTAAGIRLLLDGLRA